MANMPAGTSRVTSLPAPLTEPALLPAPGQMTISPLAPVSSPVRRRDRRGARKKRRNRTENCTGDGVEYLL
jgi:hypothetical protein